MNTPRLHLRRFQPSDLPFLDELHGDPQVVRYLGTGTVRAPEENRTWLERTVSLYSRGLGQRLVELDGVPIGRCGTSPCWVGQADLGDSSASVWFEASEVSGEARVFAELGYTFLRGHWGRGLATEAALAMRDEGAKQDLALVSLIHADHTRSMAVARRLGFDRWERARYRGRPMWLFAEPQLSES